jgi:putative oxidoreductase
MFLIHDSAAQLASAVDSSRIALSIITILAGALLLAGLFTPITGVVVALVECWTAFLRDGELWVFVMAASIGLSLAMLGPGAWSVDALVYGRKRIVIRER